jgi:hypothetical protein
MHENRFLGLTSTGSSTAHCPLAPKHWPLAATRCKQSPRGQGDFKHMVMNADMPLVWFD